MVNMQVKLLINGVRNPLGIDTSNVRLSIVGDFLKDIDYIKFTVFCGKTVVYSIKTRENFAYIPNGKLSHCTEYKCRAEIVYADSEAIFTISTFETGIDVSMTVGQWIENSNFNQNVSEYERHFGIKSGLTKCRLYIVGLGFYYSHINGEKTDCFYYKPLLTDFDVRENLNNPDYDESQFKNENKTICYDTFDITHLVKEGQNTLSVLVGTGWYCNLDKTVTDPSYSFGNPKLFFEIHVYYGDEKEIICSDEKCLVRNLPRRSQLFYGDKVDFTLSASEFIHAKKSNSPKAKLTATQCEHDVIYEEILPLARKDSQGIIEYDFGKNHTGGLYLRVKGKKNTKIKIKYYETKIDGKLNLDTSSCGLFDRSQQKFIDKIYQTSEYMLSGNVDEIYPLFHWDCYRYVTIETEDLLPIDIIEIKSLFITTGIAQNGKFNCSNEFLNRLYNAFALTQRDNMHSGVPSDCPHREKLPYTGDGQLCMLSSLNLFDAENFYRKWLKDIIASQRLDGWIPYTAPYIAGGGGCWWSNALLVVAINLYNYTGDKHILKSVFLSAKKLIDYYENSHNGDYIIVKKAVSWMLGDWLAPKDTLSNKVLINTLAFYYAVEKTLEISEILGETDDISKLSLLKSNIAKAINESFFDAEKCIYGNGVQGENILPLVYGIVPPKKKGAVLKNIIEHYKRQPQFDTGVVLTPILLDALVDFGQERLALEILMKKEYPSLSNMIEGETTLCESWDKKNNKYLDDVSRCHPMFGSVIAWVIKYVAGMDISRLYEKKIVFSPRFTDTIDSCFAEKLTSYGIARISYKKSVKLSINVKIPHGIKGIVYFKNNLLGKKFSIIDKSTDLVLGYVNKAEVLLNGGEYMIVEI